MEESILKTLISQGKSTHQIATELECSQTNVRYWLRKYGLNTNFISESKFCVVCNAALQDKQIKFCSKQCSGIKHSSNPNNYLAQQDRAFERKKLLVDQKGGKCEVCGENSIWRCARCNKMLCTVAKRKWNGAKCLFLYHSPEFFGLARSDCTSQASWTAPTPQMMEKNERMIKRWMKDRD